MVLLMAPRLLGAGVIIWVHAGKLLLWPLETNVGEISMIIKQISSKGINLQMSSVSWRSFCVGINIKGGGKLHNLIYMWYFTYVTYHMYIKLCNLPLPLIQCTAQLRIIHRGRVMHTCVSKLAVIDSDNGLCCFLVPISYLNQCSLSIHLIIGENFQWKLNKNAAISMRENALEYIIWKLVAILSWPHCVTSSSVNGVCTHQSTDSLIWFDNGLVLNRRQAIIRATDGRYYRNEYRLIIYKPHAILCIYITYI